MFPAGYTWEAVWTNVQSMLALQVVLGAIVITLSLWFAPILVRALLGLTGINRVLAPWDAAGQVREEVTDWWDDRPWHEEHRYRRRYGYGGGDDDDRDWRD